MSTVSDDCGCNNTTTTSSSVDCGCSSTNCQELNSCVSSTPNPCCDADTVRFYGNCLHVTSNITTTAGEFYLQFSDLSSCDVLPVGADVFFYHAAAGRMEILSVSGGTYKVQLTDSSKAGAIILKTDCVLTAVIPTEIITQVQRCLIDSFVAPGVGATASIFIRNGQGIPIGSIISFTDPSDGSLGSYTVQALVSSSGTTYVYTIKNEGSGHTPGSIISETETNACNIPIEVQDIVDDCDLEEVEVISSLRGCGGGVPKALKPTIGGQLLISNDSLDIEFQPSVNVDCCIITEDTLKFSDSGGLLESDSVTVQTGTGITCFDEAYTEATTYNALLIVTIEGVRYRVTSWDLGTRTITLGYTNDDYASDGEPFIEYPAGTQICIGECCNRCTNSGVQSDHKNQGTPTAQNNATISCNIASIPYNTTERFFFVGFNQAGTATYQEITAGWEATYGTSEFMPDHTVPLLSRVKICNQSTKACHQKMMVDYYLSLVVTNLPADVEVHAHWCSQIRNSLTLSDGSTALAANMAGFSRVSGNLVGPTTQNAIMTGTQAVNQSIVASSQALPAIHTNMRSRANVLSFNCANEILWCLLRVVAPSGSGTIDIELGGQRYYELDNLNEITPPANNPALEQWYGESA